MVSRGACRFARNLQSIMDSSATGPQRGWCRRCIIHIDGENCFYVEEDALGPLCEGRASR